MPEVITILEEMIKVLENIPLLLQYFVPGFWAITVFKFTSGKTIKNEYNLLFSCVISYILLSFTELILSLPYINLMPSTVYISSAISIILGTLLSIIVTCIICSEKFKQLTVQLFHRTVNKSIWKDVIDFKNGSNLKIYVKDKNYFIIGHHKNQEEEDVNDPWLAVNEYAVFNADTGEVIIDYMIKPEDTDEVKEKKKNTIYAIRLSDVEHIEIFN